MNERDALPLTSITLPTEVTAMLTEMRTQSRTGSVTLHFVRGELRSTDEHRSSRIGERQAPPPEPSRRPQSGGSLKGIG